MGHKVHPKCFRLGVTTSWTSKWFSKKKADYKKHLKEDILIKEYIAETLKRAGVVEVEIERSAGTIRILIYSTRPGVIIGRGGQGIDDLKAKMKKKYFGGEKVSLDISIQEVKNIGLSAKAVAQSMAEDIEKRTSCRRVMKRAIDMVRKAGAKGVKVIVSGRLNGAEIARSETLGWGKVPLHTIRADIDYARETAATTYGSIGIKVWIYKGEIFNK